MVNRYLVLVPSPLGFLLLLEIAHRCRLPTMASWRRPLAVVPTLSLCREWRRAQTVGRKRSWTKSKIRLLTRVPPVFLVARVCRERAQVLARNRAVGAVEGAAIL